MPHLMQHQLIVLLFYEALTLGVLEAIRSLVRVRPKRRRSAATDTAGISSV